MMILQYALYQNFGAGVHPITINSKHLINHKNLVAGTKSPNFIFLQYLQK